MGNIPASFTIVNQNKKSIRSDIYEIRFGKRNQTEH